MAWVSRTTAPAMLPRRALLSGFVTLALALAPQAWAAGPLLTAPHLRVIDDFCRGFAGRDVTLSATPTAELGLASPNVRQLSGNDDADVKQLYAHHFNRFREAPSQIVLIFQNKPANTIHAYRVDADLHFIRGYYLDSANVFHPIGAAEGQNGVDAELRWWDKEIGDEVAKIRADLAAGASADNLAKKYGVTTDTLKAWAAGAS